MKTTILSMAILAFSLTLEAKSPKNVILFIGDGMSTPQRMTAEEFAIKTGREKLYLNHLPVQSTMRTSSADSLVTDSSAAATAIACGTKTYNHGVGVDAKGKRLTSCAEVAKAAGRKVGIVTTVTINHATPVGFYGHRKDRNEGYRLGLDLIESGFDFFAGGGCERHNDKNAKEYRGDIYKLAVKEKGYRFLREDREAFLALKPGSGKVWYVGASGTLPYAIDEDEWKNVPTLAEMTLKGLELLKNPAGFLLVVEGGKIDYAGHANDAATNMRDVLALDDAVKVALDFRKKNPDTLVIVTGDHETGGMSMGFAGTGYTFYMERLALQKCSGDAVRGLIAKLHPQSFDDLKPFISENFGFDFTTHDTRKNPMALSANDVRELESAFAHDLEMVRSGTKENEAYDAQKISRLPTVVKAIMSRKCRIGWSSGGHTALPVLTTSIGPGSEQFTGFLDNTDIARIIKSFYRK